MLSKIKTELLIDSNDIKSVDIFYIKMPIDLNVIYVEYFNQS